MKEKSCAQSVHPVLTRDKFESYKAIVENKIKILLAARGILAKKESLSSDEDLNEVLEAPVSELEHMELEILVREIKYLNKSIKEIEEILKNR